MADHDPAHTLLGRPTLTSLLAARLESAKKRGELDFSHRALTYAIAQLRHWDGRRRNFITVLDAAEFMVCDRGSIQVRTQLLTAILAHIQCCLNLGPDAGMCPRLGILPFLASVRVAYMCCPVYATPTCDYMQW